MMMQFVILSAPDIVIQRDTKMATLYLICGLPCAGKTTFAKRMASEWRALRLSPDEWHVGLFGQDIGSADHYKRHDWIEAKLFELAEHCLVLGVNVILDFGSWERRERDEFRSRAKRLGARSELHYVECTEAELFRRLAERNARPDNETFVIPESEVRDLARRFQVPSQDELRRGDP
jgi:predicted kinase